MISATPPSKPTSETKTFSFRGMSPSNGTMDPETHLARAAFSHLINNLDADSEPSLSPLGVESRCGWCSIWRYGQLAADDLHPNSSHRLSLCFKLRPALLMDGLEWIDNICKRRTRSIPSSELENGTSDQTTNRPTVCYGSMAASMNCQNDICAECTRERGCSLRRPCGGCMMFAQGRDAEKALAVCAIPGPCKRGKAGCIRQCPLGLERCAHHHCESQRDGRHLASPPTFLVVCKLPRTFWSTLDLSLPYTPPACRSC